MKLMKKLGLGMFSLTLITAAVWHMMPVPTTRAQERETAYRSGNEIKFRDVIYELGGQDTRSNSGISGWSIYLQKGRDFNCGDLIIVDNPANSDTVALRDTVVQNQNDPNPVLGDDCVTQDIDTQPWVLDVDTSDLCAEAGGNWSGATCAFNNSPSQQRDPSNTHPGSSGPESEETSSTEDSSCESKGIVMGWILCPTVSLIDGTLNWVDTQVQRLLEVDQEKYAHESLRTAWAQFRNIAYIILIPMMLVMVIGTALGFEVFSAYTVKRALPRMAIAVIFITLSWYICQFLIGFFNVAGAGVSGLVTYPFREIMPDACQVPNSDGISKGITLSCLFDVPTVTGGGASGAAGGALHSIFLITLQWPALILGTVVMLIFFGLPLLLSIVIAFLVLLARQLFIIALVLVAPLAILAWIFPGNDKIWKSWWSIFSKLLMMFPLIMLLLAVGKVFAILLNEGSGGALDGAILNPILKLLAYMLPYALIPLTFKFAGGMFATLTGMVNDKGRGVFDLARRGRNAAIKSKFKKATEGGLLKGARADGTRWQQWKHRRNEGAQRWATGIPAAYRAGGVRGTIGAAWKEVRRKSGFEEANSAIEKDRADALNSVDEDEKALESHKTYLENAGKFDTKAERDYKRYKGILAARRRSIENKYNSDVQELRNAWSGKTGSGVVDAAVAVKNAETLKQLAEDAALATWSSNDGASGPAAAILSGNMQDIRSKLVGAGLGKAEVEAKMSEIQGYIKQGRLSEALRATYVATKAFERLDSYGNKVMDTARLETAVGHFERDARRFDHKVLARMLVEKAVAGGTYYEDATDMDRAIAAATAGDADAQADLVARLRGVAIKAGRAESGSGAFGKTFQLVDSLRLLDAQLSNNQITQEAYDSKVKQLQADYMVHSMGNTHASTLFHSSMKGKYIEKNLIDVMMSQIKEKSNELINVSKKYGADSDEFIAAKSEYARLLATLDSVHQQTLMSKPDIAKMIGDNIISKTIDVFVPAQPERPEVKDRSGAVVRPAQPAVPARIEKRTILSEVGSYQDDEDYQYFHREFQNATRRNSREGIGAELEAAEREMLGRAAEEAGGTDPTPGVGGGP